MYLDNCYFLIWPERNILCKKYICKVVFHLQPDNRRIDICLAPMACFSPSGHLGGLPRLLTGDMMSRIGGVQVGARHYVPPISLVSQVGPRVWIQSLNVFSCIL